MGLLGPDITKADWEKLEDTVNYCRLLHAQNEWDICDLLFAHETKQLSIRDNQENHMVIGDYYE